MENLRRLHELVQKRLDPSYHLTKEEHEEYRELLKLNSNKKGM